VREIGLAEVASSKVSDVTRFAVGYIVEGSVKKVGLPTNTAGQVCVDRRSGWNMEALTFCWCSSKVYESSLLLQVMHRRHDYFDEIQEQVDRVDRVIYLVVELRGGGEHGNDARLEHAPFCLDRRPVYVCYLVPVI